MIFSQSPGVAFPLPQHSWDATEPTQGPHSAIQSMGPHPAAEAGWSIPFALRAGICVRRQSKGRMTLLFSQVHPRFLAVDCFKEHCRIICFE